MNHIFYLHSNTCVISAFDVINYLLNNHEKVIVVTERNTKFAFFSEEITVYNMQETIDEYRILTHNVIKQALNYRMSLVPHCELRAKEIINKQDFLFYTPSYNMYSVKPFLKSKYCKGYYFIEEGFMAYLKTDTLRRHYNRRRYKQGHFLLDFVGIGESFDYNVNNLFKGCFGLSNFSFPWCDKGKVITSFDGYFKSMSYEDVNIDYLITTDWLKDDIDILKKAFITTIEKILRNDTTPQIGIKFHPTAFIDEKEKIDAIIDLIKGRYNFDFVILPASFSVEALMYHREVKIYCVFGLSSLQLYGLMLGAKPFMVVRGSTIDIKEIKSIPEFVEMATEDWNS